jgi:hypothetical protein
MRMSIREMYEDHNLFSLLNAISGYGEMQEEARKQTWEQTRMICYYALGSSKVLSPSHLFKFPWEQEEVPEMDAEKLKAMFKKSK